MQSSLKAHYHYVFNYEIILVSNEISIYLTIYCQIEFR